MNMLRKKLKTLLFGKAWTPSDGDVVLGDGACKEDQAGILNAARCQ